MAVIKTQQFQTHANPTQSSANVDIHRPQRTVLAQAISVALVAGVAPGPLFAQDFEIEEITVTATKRAESVMDVPLAITAITGEAILELNLNDTKDLIAFTPGITGNSQDSFLDFVSIRGIRTIDFGNGGDPSVSLYKNGLYQGRTGSGVSSLYDIERAEVLRGPQGFLFGRNSVSGAMNIVTRKPNVSETEGYAELDVGERGHVVFEGAMNFPLSDTFALRVAGYHSEEDGYVGNLAGGDDLIAHDKSAFRATGSYQADAWNIDLLVEYEDRDQSGTVYRATGNGNAFNVNHTRMNGGVPVDISSDGRVVNNDNSLDSLDEAKILSTGLFIDYEMSWATFSSLTGFKDHEYQYVEDFDASPLILFNYGQDQEGDYFEQEFRLTSNSDGPLSWYAGASYYKENIDTIFLGQQDEDTYCLGYWFDTCQGLFDYYNYLGYPYDYYLYYYFGSYTWTPSATGLMNDRNRVIGKYSGYSAYIDLSYQFTDSFDVSVGIRYSYDEKEFSQEVLEDPGNTIIRYRVQTGFSTPDGPLTDKQDWDDVTYRLVANWRPNDSTLLFGSVTTGYKPGGFGSFNIEGPTCAGATWGLCAGIPGVDRPGDFGPETVTSYEVGYKGTIAGGRAQLSASAFLYDYEDLQAIFGVGPIVIVDNIGKVEGRGVEVEASTIFTDNFQVQFGGSWFDSEATNVQAFCGNGEVITGDPDVCEGNSIPWAPEWTAFAVLNANFPAGNGEIFGRLAWTWEDDHRGDWPDPSIVFQNIPGINQTDIVVGYQKDSWHVSAYVENVFDELWYDGNYSNDDSDPAYLYAEHVFGPARPRTAGLRFGVNF